MYIAIVGASSAIAQALILKWIEKGEKNFILIGRNRKGLSKLRKNFNQKKGDLNILIFALSSFKIKNIYNFYNAFKFKNRIKVALICFGFLPKQADMKKNLPLLENALIINGVSPIIWTELFLIDFISRNNGTLIMLSSVAGDLGKKSNYVYGSCKALLNIYYEGLSKDYAEKKIKLLLVKAGPIKTPMTSSYKFKFLLNDCNKLASKILIAVEKKQNILYFPGYWRFCIPLIRALPSNFLNLFKV